MHVESLKSTNRQLFFIPEEKAMVFMTDGRPYDNPTEVMINFKRYLQRLEEEEILILTYGIENDNSCRLTGFLSFLRS